MPGLTPYGITGQAMSQAGVRSLASIDEFSVMGVAEVAKRLPALVQLETRLLYLIERLNPKFAVLVDNPGFHLRFAEQLRLRGIKVIQYVAPKLWAWGEGRAAALRENFQLVLGILPFEEAFFKTRKIPYAYVGSPLKDRISKVMVQRQALGIPQNRPVIACLPGSRSTEVSRNLRTILAVKHRLERELPDALFIVPVPSNLAVQHVASYIMGGQDSLKHHLPGEGVVAHESWSVHGLHFVPEMSLELMAVADAAIVASGTATLECALLGAPMVVIYTMNELTYQLARRAVKIPYVSLVNLIAGKRLVTEYIQNFRIDDIAAEILALLRDKELRQTTLAAFLEIRDSLTGDAAHTAAAKIAAEFRDAKLALT